MPLRSALVAPRKGRARSAHIRRADNLLESKHIAKVRSSAHSIWQVFRQFRRRLLPGFGSPYVLRFVPDRRDFHPLNHRGLRPRWVAAGACAAFGGIHAMEGNPTGCMGLPDYLGANWRSHADIPIICVPDCPVQTSCGKFLPLRRSDASNPQYRRPRNDRPERLPARSGRRRRRICHCDSPVCGRDFSWRAAGQQRFLRSAFSGAGGYGR